MIQDRSKCETVQRRLDAWLNGRLVVYLKEAQELQLHAQDKKRFWSKFVTKFFEMQLTARKTSMVLTALD